MAAAGAASASITLTAAQLRLVEKALLSYATDAEKLAARGTDPALTARVLERVIAPINAVLDVIDSAVLS